MQAPDRSDPFDALLTRAFAAEPPAGSLAAMDARVAEALARRPSTRAMRPPALRLPRRRTVAGLMLAALVLGGAGMSIMSAFGRMTGSAFRVAWERGVEFNLSDVVDGYGVTVHRAYADRNQMMIAVSVEDLEDRGHSQVASWGMAVRDESGVVYPQARGGSAPVDRFASADLYWFSMPHGVVGSRHLIVSMEQVGVRDRATPPAAQLDNWDPWHTVPGPWVFEFDLEIQGGSAIAPGFVAEHDETTLELDTMQFSPSQVRVDLRMTGLSSVGSSWAPIVEIRRDGHPIPVGGTGALDVGADPAEVLTVQGVDDPSGEWTVTVTELVGHSADGQVRLQGPWVFHVTVP